MALEEMQETDLAALREHALLSRFLFR